MKPVITSSKIQAFSPNILVRKFSVNGQFLQIFGQIPQDFLTRKLGEKAHILSGVRFMPTFNLKYQLMENSQRYFAER